jgi:hypothetical protein
MMGTGQCRLKVKNVRTWERSYVRTWNEGPKRRLLQGTCERGLQACNLAAVV